MKAVGTTELSIRSADDSPSPRRDATMDDDGDASMFSFSLSSFPDCAAAMSEAGVPFGCIVQPFAALPSETISTTAAEDVGRCEDCGAYINTRCSLVGERWRCALCGALTPLKGPYSEVKGARREHFVELQTEAVEFTFADGVVEHPVCKAAALHGTTIDCSTDGDVAKFWHHLWRESTRQGGGHELLHGHTWLSQDRRIVNGDIQDLVQAGEIGLCCHRRPVGNAVAPAPIAAAYRRLAEGGGEALRVLGRQAEHGDALHNEQHHIRAGGCE